MKKIFLAVFVIISMHLSGQDAWFTFRGGRLPAAGFRIVIPAGAHPGEQRAAKELQHYIARVTGVNPSIGEPRQEGDGGQIILGHTDVNPAGAHHAVLEPDGYHIRIRYPEIYITGGSPRGTLFGVYTFLEKYFGCRFWAPGAESIPVKSNILLPDIDFIDNPAFRSREVYYAGMDEDDFTSKMRCNNHAWKGNGDWGMWVHTMFSMVPPEKYFDEHPEYYALMAGKRAKTQLCLTNHEVLEITIRGLREKMKEKPLAKYWSVSQMDTFGHCECDECKAIDDHEGSPSGSLIAFVNNIAAAFPNKVISTLAYQYTRKPPKHLKPAANVNIMLCTIECDRSRPLLQDSTPGSFYADLRAWSAIAKDILVWDYVIQFTNMIAPFPNLPVLQPNIRLFKMHNVSAVFEQGCHVTYSENQELRQYLLAKLLWDPELNADSLISGFLEGYYGPAGAYIKQYINMMEEKLTDAGKPLLIYGSPVQETDAFLDPLSMAAYDSLFVLAKQAVAGDDVLTARVVKAGLPLQYAKIECAKGYITGPDGFIMANTAISVVDPAMISKVNDFVQLASLHGVTTVHERSLPPSTYGQQTLAYFSSAYTLHLAKGRDYILTAQPAEKYSAGGPGSLTDGKRGSANYFVLWQGFEGMDLTAIVDLTDLTLINYVGAGFLQDLASWIFYPEKIVISLSQDGRNWSESVVFDSLSFTDPVMIRESGKVIPPVRTRYVKFQAKNIGRCPPWHIGHGGKAWLFSDELIVDYRP